MRSLFRRFAAVLAAFFSKIEQVGWRCPYGPRHEWIEFEMGVRMCAECHSVELLPDRRAGPIEFAGGGGAQ